MSNKDKLLCGTQPAEGQPDSSRNRESNRVEDKSKAELLRVQEVEKEIINAIRACRVDRNSTSQGNPD